MLKGIPLLITEHILNSAFGAERQQITDTVYIFGYSATTCNRLHTFELLYNNATILYFTYPSYKRSFLAQNEKMQSEVIVSIIGYINYSSDSVTVSLNILLLKD